MNPFEEFENSLKDRFKNESSKVPAGLKSRIEEELKKEGLLRDDKANPKPFIWFGSIAILLIGGILAWQLNKKDVIQPSQQTITNETSVSNSKSELQTKPSAEQVTENPAEKETIKSQQALISNPARDANESPGHSSSTSEGEYKTHSSNSKESPATYSENKSKSSTSNTHIKSKNNQSTKPANENSDLLTRNDNSNQSASFASSAINDQKKQEENNSPVSGEISSNEKLPASANSSDTPRSDVTSVREAEEISASNKPISSQNNDTLPKAASQNQDSIETANKPTADSTVKKRKNSIELFLGPQLSIMNQASAGSNSDSKNQKANEFTAGIKANHYFNKFSLGIGLSYYQNTSEIPTEVTAVLDSQIYSFSGKIITEFSVIDVPVLAGFIITKNKFSAHLESGISFAFTGNISTAFTSDSLNLTFSADTIKVNNSFNSFVAQASFLYAITNRSSLFLQPCIKLGLTNVIDSREAKLNSYSIRLGYRLNF